MVGFSGDIKFHLQILITIWTDNPQAIKIILSRPDINVLLAGGLFLINSENFGLMIKKQTHRSNLTDASVSIIRSLYLPLFITVAIGSRCCADLFLERSCKMRTI